MEGSKARKGWRAGSRRPSSHGSNALLTLASAVPASDGKCRKSTDFIVDPVDPVETLACVDILTEVVRVEAITEEPPGRVEDEDLEQRLAEPEPRWAVPFAQRAHQQVHVLDPIGPVDVLTVERPQRRGDLAVFRELVEAPDAVEPELRSQRVVRRHTPLTVAEQVERSEVDDRLTRNRKVQQRGRIVVVDERARELQTQ